MAKYTIQRILAMLLTMFIILTVGFMVIRLMPGGIFDDAVDMTHEQRANKYGQAAVTVRP